MVAGDRATPQSQEMEHGQQPTGGTLLPEHRASLRKRAIADAEIDDQGFFTLQQGARSHAAELGFSEAQSRLLGAGHALIIPRFNVAGESDGYQMRPDAPRTMKGKDRPNKYENLPGVPPNFDIPPRCAPYMRDKAVTLYVVESTMKACALKGAGAQAVASIGGVYNWKSAQALAELDNICERGRVIVLVPDSDYHDPAKQGVRDGWTRLGSLAQAHGADVLFCPIPDMGDGAKRGPDDWLADGHTLSEIVNLKLDRVTKFSAPRVEGGRKIPKYWAGFKQHAVEVEDALEALRLADAEKPELFTRGGDIVSVVNDEDGRATIKVLGDADVRLRLSWAADYVNGDDKAVVPPKTTVEGVRAHGNPGFNPLRSIATMPFVRQDGVLVQKPGYDEISGVYLALPAELAHLDVPVNPTEAEREAALETLLDPFQDFPFEEDADKANALSMLFEGALRELCGITPAHVFDKPQPRTGAGLLADVVGVIITGQPVAASAWSDNDDEMQKVIVAEQVRGAPIILFDNVTGTVNSPALNRALTAHRQGGRYLGTNKSVDVPNRASWLINGNLVAITGDMGGRSTMTKLNAHTEKPGLRTGFKYADLLAHVRANRRAIVKAVCTLATAWIADGKPEGPKVVKGGFQPWANVMSGVLAHAGIKGFEQNAVALLDDAASPLAQWIPFAEKWEVAFLAPVCVKEAMAVIEMKEPVTGRVVLTPEWAGVFPDMAGKGTRGTQLSYCLRYRMKGVVLPGGLSFVIQGENKNLHQPLWTVVNTRTQPSGCEGSGKTSHDPISNAKVAKVVSAQPIRDAGARPQTRTGAGVRLAEPSQPSHSISEDGRTAPRPSQALPANDDGDGWSGVKDAPAPVLDCQPCPQHPLARVKMLGVPPQPRCVVCHRFRPAEAASERAPSP